ncbi:MAG: RNA polymerase-binding protein DksA [Alphaproteobacteria bacterium]|nr:MAG: RNA polymerase-binding protein DksA [Alphaproteobacteria bacterium]
MNPTMLEYFRQCLLRWRDEIIAESAETISHLQEETINEPDLADRATSEVNRSFELRTRDRGRKLLIKIDEALSRIADKSYGYCEKTGEPIGIGRLEARPIATLSLEAQELHEKSERLHSE